MIQVHLSVMVTASDGVVVRAERDAEMPHVAVGMVLHEIDGGIGPYTVGEVSWFAKMPGALYAELNPVDYRNGSIAATLGTLKKWFAGWDIEVV